MKGYIYQIENLVTQESYIGQTIDIKRRKRTHFNELRNNTHKNPKLENSINKYGEQEFHFRFWEFDTTPEELNKLECEYIEKFNSLKNGFNLVSGGGKPPKHQKVKDEDIDIENFNFDELREKLNEIKIKKRYSFPVMARFIGVSEVTLSNFCRGKRNILKNNIPKFMRFVKGEE